MRKVMTLNVGLERDEAGLTHALDVIGKMEKAGANDPDLRNMTAACLLIAACALRRKESRGGHYRTDYPKTKTAWASRTFVTLKQTREIAEAALKETRPATKPTVKRA
jgi:L-aspartate oxidase